jgi:hypothetical protein
MMPAAALALLMSVSAPAKAQEPAESAVAFDVRQKQMFGDDGYVSGDTDLNVALPYGLNANAAYSFYKNDFSSMTHTLYLGAGIDWDARSLGITYSLTPWSNGYHGDSYGASVSMRTGTRDFRTTLGAEVTVLHHSQLIDGPNRTVRADVTQRTPTISVRQQLYGLRASADLSEHHYNKNVEAASRQLAVASLRHPGIASKLAGASGLVQGFPDWTARLGLSQELDMLPRPVRAWVTYTNTHFLDTFQSPEPGVIVLQTSQTSDSVMAGVDVDITASLSATLQYNHVRQSYQPSSDYYGFAVGWQP